MTPRKQAGTMIEHILMRRFHALPSFVDEADFMSKHKLFEVKSCKLLIAPSGVGGRGFQLGRFTIDLRNHIKLRVTAAEHGKKPVYVFAVRYHKQVLTRTLSWHEVDALVDVTCRTTHIPLKKIYEEE